MLRLKDIDIVCSREQLKRIPDGKMLINTINAHSYNVAQTDALFAEALSHGDKLIPDGASIVKACRWMGAQSQPKERIAGWDLFVIEMEKLNQRGADTDVKPCCLFVGSSEEVLQKITEKAKNVYPHIRIETYSPPYKPEFTEEENNDMVTFINKTNPDLLWFGMTAPKQEKWAYQHWDRLYINCHAGTIGAVFDFFAGTAQRAPLWWQRHSLEWLYRLCKEPRRMWRRYLIGNILFIINIVKEKYTCNE